jgi:hypothetical protein
VRSEIQKQAAKTAREKAERERAAQAAPISKKPPSPHKAAVAEMFKILENIQEAFPRSKFAAELLHRDNSGDLETVGQIVEAIGLNVAGFSLHLMAAFKGLDAEGRATRESRAPGRANGPDSLGLILEWAKDYRRARRGRGAGGDS